MTKPETNIKASRIVSVIIPERNGNGAAVKREFADRSRFLQQLKKCHLAGFDWRNGDTTAVAVYRNVPVLKVLKLKTVYILEYNENFWTED